MLPDFVTCNYVAFIVAAWLVVCLASNHCKTHVGYNEAWGVQ